MANDDQKTCCIFLFDRREPHLRLHEHLHQDGFAAGTDVVSLSALDCGCGRRDGRVCHIVATDHHKDATFDGLYVQRNELDFMLLISALLFGEAITLSNVIGSAIIMLLGVVGSYLGKVFEQTKNRPAYIIKNTENL